MAFLTGFFNWLFGWAVNVHPIFGIFIVTLLMTFLTTLAYKYLTDQHVMKSLKDEVKKLQKKLKENRDNTEKFSELNKEIISKNMKMFKLNFKPMLASMVVYFVVLPWMRLTYADYGYFTGNLLWFLGWLGTYILFALILSLILRKVLKVQ